eukprot:GILK01009204.1.p1 GENE.GILK01009204.1~~GILK01009204.1.p1  ORF type:complete len:1213 (-),score=194.95 GILK01009204.1:193-3831(-)
MSTRLLASLAHILFLVLSVCNGAAGLSSCTSTTSEYAQADFTNTVSDTTDMKSTAPFVLDTRLAFDVDTLVGISTAPGVSGTDTTVSRISLDGYWYNGLSAPVLTSLFDGLWSMDSEPSYHLDYFINPETGLNYTETKQAVVFNAENPKQVAISGQYVAWTQDSLSDPTKSTVMVQKQVHRANVTSALQDSVSISLSFDWPSRTGVSQSHPSICSNYLAYQEIDSSNLASVWLYHLAAGSKEPLNQIEGQTSSYFFPVLTSRSTSDDSADWPSASCVATWMEASHTISVDTNRNLDLGSTAVALSWLNSITIHMLLLPSRASLSISSAQWQTGSYTLLHNGFVSGDYFFILVSYADLSSYMIRTAYLPTYLKSGTLTFSDVMSSVSSSPLRFANGQNEALLYWQNVGSDWNLNGLYYAGSSDKSYYETHCTVLSTPATSSVLSAAFSTDTVFYSDGSKLHLIDLNKDNDILWDLTDLFPLNGHEITDSDNDGVGDGEDIVTATGPCVTSSTEKCLPDLTILYIEWSCFVVVTSVCVWFGVRFFKRQYRRAMELAEQAVEYDGPDIELELEKQVEQRMSNQRMVAFCLQLFILALAVLSIVLAVIPIYSFTPRPLTDMILFAWIDFHITWLFVLDLVARFIVRNKRREPTIWNFCIANWYDFPALLTDIPGATLQTPLSVVKILPRIWRIIRIVKVFRVVRFYRKVTRQSSFVTWMIKRPGVFLTGLMVLIIVSAAILLKIMEQGVAPNFERLDYVFWFVLSTVTTVGYGDMYPISVYARLLTMVLMFVGVGLIGTLSANIARNILTVGNTEDKINQLKKVNRERVEVHKSSLSKLMIAYNPVLAAIPQIFSLNSKTVSTVDERQRVNLERRSLLGSTVPEDLEKDWTRRDADLVMVRVSLEEAQLLSDVQSLREINTDVEQTASMTKKLYSESIVSEIIKDAQGKITPVSRLRFMLRTYQMDSEKFQLLVKELVKVIFEPPRQNNIFLERMFTLQHYLTEHNKTVDDGYFDLRDPLDDKLRRVEEILRNPRYDISKRFDSEDILADVFEVVLLWDRVVTARWAMQNIVFKPSARINPPAIRVIPLSTKQNKLNRRSSLAYSEGAKAKSNKPEKDNETESNPPEPSVLSKRVSTRSIPNHLVGNMAIRESLGGSRSSSRDSRKDHFLSQRPLTSSRTESYNTITQMVELAALLNGEMGEPMSPLSPIGRNFMI